MVVTETMIQYESSFSPRRLSENLKATANPGLVNADDRFLARPKGATQSTQYCVMGLAKGTTIACNPSLVLSALDCSVSIKPKLLEYLVIKIAART